MARRAASKNRAHHASTCVPKAALTCRERAAHTSRPSCARVALRAASGNGTTPGPNAGPRSRPRRDRHNAGWARRGGRVAGAARWGRAEQGATAGAHAGRGPNAAAGDRDTAPRWAGEHAGTAAPRPCTARGGDSAEPRRYEGRARAAWSTVLGRAAPWPGRARGREGVVPCTEEEAEGRQAGASAPR
jgi:hypothetical protein